MFKCVVYSNYHDYDGDQTKTLTKALYRVLYLPFAPQLQRMSFSGLLRAEETSMVEGFTWDIDNEQFECLLIGGMDKSDLKEGIHPEWTTTVNGVSLHSLLSREGVS